MLYSYIYNKSLLSNYAQSRFVKDVFKEKIVYNLLEIATNRIEYGKSLRKTTHNPNGIYSIFFKKYPGGDILYTIGNFMLLNFRNLE